MTIVIPGHARPSVRITEKGKWSKSGKTYLAWQKHVADCCIQVRPRPLPWEFFRVTVVFYFANRRHGDLTNCWKAVEDGLQYGGVIPNDKQVRQVTMRYEYVHSVEDECVEVILEPLE